MISYCGIDIFAIALLFSGLFSLGIRISKSYLFIVIKTIRGIEKYSCLRLCMCSYCNCCRQIITVFYKESSHTKLNKMMEVIIILLFIA